MLSGNGRHRRPRQAPALLVAAGVTGSAIALPLLGAAGAHAADATTWDKVAECESGGSWSADTGNGYYGGLQISQDDWDAYGGTQYADSADQASRLQQIAVAEKILADRGTTPWATCALLSGLTPDSGSVDVDTGVGEPGQDGRTGEPSAPADGSGTSDTPGESGTPSGRPDPSPSTEAGSGSGSGTPSSPDAGGTPDTKPGKGKGRHKGKEADEDAAKGTGGTTGPTGTNTPKSDKSPAADAGNPQGADSAPSSAPDAGVESNPQRAAGSWSLVDTGAVASGGRHRGASADETVTNGQDATLVGRHATREADTYTVRQGDSLVSIADSLDVDGGWHALYAGNKKAIGADPNRITAGQTLEVGGETGGK
ncbi:transglycosylase family protein [Streptomyces sp. NPDC017086]|uniref:transglycosylase family protein n=1 Tax=Streptomyces sp. NPDC017086 TaxID=3364976 RepID=UPI0037BB59FC